ncbi:MAG: response regulator PleD [Methanoregula sp. PtaU1.Bin006]|uniref:hybrid sensor histidine kinase/response regulator n=3 Tax=unclassified Methanoregula TaxID=2649730 RepID=UPI0009D517BA|nr:hybrid sensor histidine kinase/response regulator [Methanoregula sp. PtaU1.Bin006]OPY31583.1 MAG: response regulator PleD [Methanoregula sp. PtaU1.Bin006]
MNPPENEESSPRKILVVEDSRTQAEMLKHTLEMHGYVVTLAENGRAALDLLDALQPDLIISDIVMPVMDGYEFCRTVKDDERFRHIPVILLTMLTNSRDVIYAMVSGADNFITKPYQGEYLVSRLKRILSHRNAMVRTSPAEPPIEFPLSGKKFTIYHDRRQVIELLLSAYEAAVIQHQELLVSQKKLAEANDEANLYLDIITHDINNVNSGALALTELLVRKSRDTEKALALRLESSINESTVIINNVSTIRRLHERREALKPMPLDEIIRESIRQFPNTTISYGGTQAVVLADSLVRQVFINLIGNSAKFSGIHAVISIDVKDAGEMVEVTVTDNGPGIDDELKPVVFDRFKKGKSTKSGKGLGLFIVRSLVESYGGSIRAGDAVPGRSGTGASIHFTLKKAA